MPIDKGGGGTMNERKITDWKQQFFEVRKIGEEPALTRPPWKKFKPEEIKAVDGNKTPKVTSD